MDARELEQQAKASRKAAAEAVDHRAGDMTERVLLAQVDATLLVAARLEQMIEGGLPTYSAGRWP